MKKYEGFSLMESLLVLLCISVFFMVPFITIKTWKNQLAIDQFFNQLERMIQMTHQSAITEGKITRIYQQEKNQSINFEYYYHWEKRIDELKVVDHLVLRSNEIIEFNATTGNIKKIQTVKIEDHLNNQVVRYKFQLGSGKVIRSVSKS